MVKCSIETIGHIILLSLLGKITTFPLVIRSEVSKDFRNLWQVCRFALEIILNSCACMLSHFSHVQFFAALWTVAHQAPVSVGFSLQEYWSRLPFSPPGDLPDPGIEPMSPASPALAGRFFTTEPLGKPMTKWNQKKTPALSLYPPHGMTQGPCLVCGYRLVQRGSRPRASSQMVPLL